MINLAEFAFYKMWVDLLLVQGIRATILQNLKQLV